MHNPELLSLTQIDWQFFMSFTFRRERMPERVRLSMFFAMVREQCHNFGAHFKRVPWALRREHGEATGRYHFHAVIAGLPPNVRTAATCFSWMRIWEKHGGGWARVSIYNPTLDGVDYILKRGDELTGSLATRWAGDYHELMKFGGSCDVMLSERLCRLVLNRMRSGQRGKGPKEAETGGTDTASSTLQSGAGESPLPTVNAATIAQ